MAEILGATMPSFGGGAGMLGSINWILVLVILLFVVAGAIIIFVVYQSRIYNRRIIVFENIAGQGFQPTFKDRARLVSVGTSGEQILYLKKKKVYRTAYGRKMGKNTYWFVIGQDGYWYNSILGDLDAKMGMLDIEPIDRDMRYMHVAIGRNIEKRYQKVKFMEKYGTIVMNGIFLIIMIVGIGMLIGKMGDIATANNLAMTTANQVLESTRDILTSMDNICIGGGSGLIPVA